jgi:hypothetical protein
MRHEHQLFIGLSALALLGLGTWASQARRFSAERRGLVLIHLGALLGLVLLTVQVNGVSLYRLIWMLPGMGSIRSVTRIILVMMWPVAVTIAFAVDGLLAAAGRWTSALHARRLPGKLNLNPVLLVIPPLLLGGLLLLAMLADSASFDNYSKYSKRHSQERLSELRALLPASIPQNPILFVGTQIDKQEEEMAEMDGMLLAQELGWPTLNGFSGNVPPGYGQPFSCREAPNRVQQYIAFANSHPQDFSSVPTYLDLMKRVVPIGFTDCDPAWWVKEP